MREFDVSKEMAEAVVIYETSGELLEQRLDKAKGSLAPYTDPVDAIVAHGAMLERAPLIIDVVKSQIIELREKYGDERRTNITYHSSGQEQSDDGTNKCPICRETTTEAHIFCGYCGTSLLDA